MKHKLWVVFLLLIGIPATGSPFEVPYFVENVPRGHFAGISAPSHNLSETRKLAIEDVAKQILGSIGQSYNHAYLEPWGDHYQSFVLAPQNFSAVVDYADQRSEYIKSQILSEVPLIDFEITTNGGADFSVSTPDVQLDGNGWLNIKSVKIIE